jgi:hypothetical protein
LDRQQAVDAIALTRWKADCMGKIRCDWQPMIVTVLHTGTGFSAEV